MKTPQQDLVEIVDELNAIYPEIEEKFYLPPELFDRFRVANGRLNLLVAHTLGFGFYTPYPESDKSVPELITGIRARFAELIKKKERKDRDAKTSD